LLYFAVPTLILVLAWHLTGRFIHALNEAEALNLNLVNRINEAYERMNEDFDKRRILERKQAAAEAREHVFSDLHDDLGAKLLTLAISAANPENADIARTALHDLRDVVSRSSHETTELVYLLASWREEMEGRLLTAGVNLEWQQSDDLPDVRVSHSVAIEIGRILREGISNVLRHAQAMHLQVEVEHDDEHVAISFEDDGKGMKEQTRGGRGMQNMKMRAAKVGGNISWEHGRLGGCWIKMTVPLTRLNSFSNE
jgi:signal transduction histidine kinase